MIKLTKHVNNVNLIEKKGLHQCLKLQDLCGGDYCCDCECSGGKTNSNPTLSASHNNTKATFLNNTWARVSYVLASSANNFP